jgi:hypothetical protein
MELETINRLYLELSQVATANTAREVKLRDQRNSAIVLINRLIEKLHDRTFNDEAAEEDGTWALLDFARGFVLSVESGS